MSLQDSDNPDPNQLEDEPESVSPPPRGQSDLEGPQDRTLSIEALNRIDRVCCDFEDAWKKGQKPRIESHLEKCERADRSRLLRELILLDVEWRFRGGEHPTEEQYARRFPDDTELIGKIPFGFPVSTPTETESIGPYKILGVLGEGGMGVVYLAEQREPIRRRVALKVIKQGMDTREVVARFEAERQALALMNHPNVAKVYEAGATESGRPYFVMEYVQGTPLTEFCDRHNLPIPERLKLFVQVCQGVAHAHHRGIVHRDLKPSNVLVARPDVDAVAKIIDFGVAKATNQRLTEKTIYTEVGRAVGTPAYMSPEQAEMTTEDVDHRSDIYSLGVLLYELLVGETPLDWESLAKEAYQEIVRRIQEEEPLSPSVRWTRLNLERTTALAKRRGADRSGLSATLRGDLDWITMKSLEKERERRYRTASELASDVERHLRNDPVLAGPPNSLYRARKFLRRNRAPVITVTAVFVALSVGLVVSLINYRQAVVSQRQAERSFRDARGVVDEFFTDVSESEELLRGTHGTQELRKRLLDRARRYYEAFAAEHQGDPEVERDLARALSRLGQIAAATGDEARAQVVHLRALSLWERLALREPRNPEYPSRLAATHAAIARLERRAGRPLEARKAADSALRLRARVVNEYRRSPQTELDLAESYQDIGLLESESGRQDEALAAYDKALEIAERLTRERPDVPEYRSRLGEVLRRLGDLHRQNGSSQEALAAYERARRTCARLASSFSSHRYRNELAAIHDGLGELHREAGDTRKALTSYRRALDQRLPLAGENPAVTEYQMGLAATYDNLGNLYRETGDLDQGMTNCEEAFEIRVRMKTHHPTIASYRRELATSYLSRGLLRRDGQAYEEALREFERALSVNERLLREEPSVAQHKRDLAKTLNEMAWLQATCPEDTMRDGLLAEGHALRACQLTGFLNARYIETLAAAHAETGRFDEAVERQTEALESAELNDREGARSRLALYTEEKPYRETSAEDESKSSDLPATAPPARSEEEAR